MANPFERWPEKGEMVEKKCPECNGRGKDKDGKTCSKCDGRGIVITRHN